MSRRRVPVIAAITVLAAGAGLFGNGVFMAAKAEAAQILLAQSWDRARSGEAEPRPWPWADTWAVARIAAPRLDQSAIVLAEAGGEALAFGPTHLSSTPQPGDPGTSVIAAHRDTHFEFLKDMQIGDAVELEAHDGESHTYIVDDLKVVRADASGIDPREPGKRLALVTCFPFNTTEQGPLRYVVFATAEEDLI